MPKLLTQNHFGNNVCSQTNINKTQKFFVYSYWHDELWLLCCYLNNYVFGILNFVKQHHRETRMLSAEYI